VQQFRSTARFIRDTVLRDDKATPLVLGTASRLLAAVTVCAFPVAHWHSERASDRPAISSRQLRRAVEFIESNVSYDISTSDIAAALPITPRELLDLFRRHLDTPPMAYLRRSRLAYAHHDLIAATNTTDTVAAIAARWGFAHPGRLAVQYRQMHGRSPRASLQR